MFTESLPISNIKAGLKEVVFRQVSLNMYIFLLGLAGHVLKLCLAVIFFEFPFTNKKMILWKQQKTHTIIINVQCWLYQVCSFISELQISCVFAFFTLWKRVKTHVLSDQSVHITHTYCCVSKLSKFGAYLYSRIHNTFFVFEKFPVITSLYTFRRRERIHTKGTECLLF